MSFTKRSKAATRAPRNLWSCRLLTEPLVFSPRPRTLSATDPLPPPLPRLAPRGGPRDGRTAGSAPAPPGAYRARADPRPARLRPRAHAHPAPHTRARHGGRTRRPARGRTQCRPDRKYCRASERPRRRGQAGGEARGGSRGPGARGLTEAAGGSGLPRYSSDTTRGEDEENDDGGDDECGARPLRRH